MVPRFEETWVQKEVKFLKNKLYIKEVCIRKCIDLKVEEINNVKEDDVKWRTRHY